MNEGETKIEPRGALRTAKRIAFAAVPAAFVALLAVGVMRSAPRSVVGGEVPEFKLSQLAPGAPAVSSDGLRGKPVVVNFFASWCISCRVEAPLLEKTWKSYRGLIVLGVTYQDAEEDARDFIERFNITFPVARDTNQELANQFGVKGVPETFFIDHNWTFAAIGSGKQIGTRGKTVIYGAISPALLRSQVELLIERAKQDRRLGP